MAPGGRPAASVGDRPQEPGDIRHEICDPRELFTPTFTSPPLWRGLTFAKLLIVLARPNGFRTADPQIRSLMLKESDLRDTPN